MNLQMKMVVSDIQGNNHPGVFLLGFAWHMWNSASSSLFLLKKKNNTFPYLLEAALRLPMLLAHH
jgi:hypothetical protein